MTEEIKVRAPEGTQASIKKAAKLASRPGQTVTQSDFVRDAVADRIAAVFARKQKATA